MFLSIHVETVQGKKVKGVKNPVTGIR